MERLPTPTSRIFYYKVLKVLKVLKVFKVFKVIKGFWAFLRDNATYGTRLSTDTTTFRD